MGCPHRNDCADRKLKPFCRTLVSLGGVYVRGYEVFLSIIILSTFFPSSSAQQALDSASGARFVVANVFDAHGNAVRDLTKENFRLRLNGKPAAVLDARYSIAPRRIVVLLDMSGSMTGDKASGKWRIAREAAEDLLAEAPGDVPIALLTFSGKVRDVFDFSQARTAIAKWLKESPGQQPTLKHSARTALFDAILAGLRLLQPIQPGDTVYAITDGGDNASKASAAQTKAAVLQSGVRLFTLLFAEPLTPPEEQEGKDSFLSMVDDSGGFAFGLVGRQRPFGTSSEVDYANDKDNQEKIKLYTQQLNIQVNGFWTLELTAPSANKKDKMKLEVVDHEGKMRKDVWITYCRVLHTAKY